MSAYGYFIDFLEVRQKVKDFQGTIGKARNWREDLVTGELTSGRIHPFTYEGSDTTSLQISADHEYIVISGNPSRYNRVDNLYGYTTIDDCMKVYNRILEKLGLPIFTKSTKFHYLQLNKKDKSTNIRQGDGAEIRRIDWTKNFEVGKDNEKTLLAAVSTQTIKAKWPYLFSNGDTVTYSHMNNAGGKGSSQIYHKVYRKGADFERFRSNKNKYGKLSEHSQKYFDKLHEHVNETGIIREEKEFKSEWLAKYKLNWYGITKEAEFIPHLGELEDIMKRLTVSENDYKTIKKQLLNSGACKNMKAARSTAHYFNEWTAGEMGEKTSAWYVAKKRLKILGYDISIPLDITRKLPQSAFHGVNLTLRDAVPPEWYRFPDKRLN